MSEIPALRRLRLEDFVFQAARDPWQDPVSERGRKGMRKREKREDRIG